MAAESSRLLLEKMVSNGLLNHTSTWQTLALQKGMRIKYVSRLMGHASVKNTEIYAKILDSELDKAMEIFSE